MSDDYTDLEARLRRTPLYHGHGEEADLPEVAADAIRQLRAERKAITEDCSSALHSNIALRERAEAAEAALADALLLLQEAGGLLANFSAYEHLTDRIDAALARTAPRTSDG